MDQQILFAAGQGGYVTYRIPSLVVTNAGTVLAFCEGRTQWRDTCEIHLLVRRSFDSGVTWSPPQLVAKQKDFTCGNPCAVVERKSGTVFLAFCKNPLLEGSTDQVAEGQGERTVWLTHSGDDGVTWSEPRELTPAVKLPNWTWYATGPGHGIQLGTGRLIVPCCHAVGVNLRADDPEYAHMVYSDDGGATWRCGGDVGPGCDEPQVVELPGGRLYLSTRNPLPSETGCRTFAFSSDGGLTFTPRQLDPALIEPTLWNGCQASLVLCGNDVLFVNPATRENERKNLALRVSRDGCRTWSAGLVLHAGPSAYSDLAVAPDGTILCLYEGGREHPYETLTLARVDAGQLE